MRAFALGLILCGVAVPCPAQTVLKSDPLVLAPYEIALVQDASCPAGKVLKVTGAIRGLHRRKACVSLASEQASLATATPGGIGSRGYRAGSPTVARSGRRARARPCCWQDLRAV